MAARIEIKGLKETKEALRAISRDLVREFNKGLREDARPLLNAYKAYASGLGGTGQYASNASMRTMASGIKIVNTDPGAGTIEFANPGAFYRTGRLAGKKIGVPSAPKPRALMRAVDENEPQIVARVESRLAQFIDGHLNG